MYRSSCGLIDCYQIKVKISYAINCLVTNVFGKALDILNSFRAIKCHTKYITKRFVNRKLICTCIKCLFRGFPGPAFFLIWLRKRSRWPPLAFFPGISDVFTTELANIFSRSFRSFFRDKFRSINICKDFLEFYNVNISGDTKPYI